MAAKYRKIDPRIWHDERFVTLGSDERLLALYCLTAQSNRCGLFVFSVGKAAEDLSERSGNVTPNVSGRLLERLRRVVSTLRWKWDETARVLYFPTWWKYNPPENLNVIRGALKDLDDLPETPLLEEFYGNVRYLPESCLGTFQERLANVRGTLPQTVTESGTGTGTGTGTGEPPNPPQAGGGSADESTIKIPPELDTEDFRRAWGEWKAERAAKRKNYTPRGEREQLRKLAAFGPAAAVAAIRDSIAQGWQGLFPEKHANDRPRSGNPVRPSARVEFDPTRNGVVPVIVCGTEASAEADSTVRAGTAP